MSAPALSPADASGPADVSLPVQTGDRLAARMNEGAPGIGGHHSPEPVMTDTDEELHYAGVLQVEGETAITPETAMVVIAQELRGVRRVLQTMAFDPNCETTVDRISTVLHDALHTFGRRGDGPKRSLAEHVEKLAEEAASR